MVRTKDVDLSPLLSGLDNVSAEAVRDADAADVLRGLVRLVERGGLDDFAPMLPWLLRLEGRPYSLRDHFVFRPVFAARNLPRNLTIQSGRQVSKTTGMAASNVVLSGAVPFLKVLFVSPLFEQIRRFSSHFIKPFVETSPVRRLWADWATENSVLQRSFRNRSRMIFGYAGQSADRLRGVPADVLNIDECQDVDPVHMPIILETVSHSDWGLVRWTGTPKTTSTLLHQAFDRSSKAEWFVPCFSCTTGGHPTWNIPSMEHHLMKMIGPWRADISEESPGTICHKCGKPVNPRRGGWVHRHPDRVAEHVGLHVPQLVMPHHYASPDRWAVLRQKLETQAFNVFANEAMGEACDVGSQLVSEDELKAACTLECDNIWSDPDGEPDPAVMEEVLRSDFRALAIDWGGGGRKGVSYTTLALVCWTADGRLRVPWGKRLLQPHDHVAEAEEIRKWLLHFRPHVVPHDFTGAGVLRETYLIQVGVPKGMLMPVAYVRSATRPLLVAVEATAQQPRAHFQADKTRTLLYTCVALKRKLVRFYRYDYRGEERPGLIRQFLALEDDIQESAHTSGIYMIKRSASKSDDFAHATNLGCVACWHFNDAWPDFAHLAGAQPLTAYQAANMGRPKPEMAGEEVFFMVGGGGY